MQGVTINMRVVVESVSDNCDRSLFDLIRFLSVSSDFPPFRTFGADLSCHFLQEVSANHSKVSRRKKRLRSRGVLGPAAVSNFRKNELTLHKMKRIFDLCPNSGFDSFCCVTRPPRDRFQAQRPAIARHHRNVPIHLKTLCLFAFLYTAIARICEYVGLLSVRKVPRLGDLLRVSG